MQILKNIEYSNKPKNNKYKTVSVNMDKVKA